MGAETLSFILSTKRNFPLSSMYKSYVHKIILINHACILQNPDARLALASINIDHTS